jgi:nitrate/nitrite transport system ATP-binding protein
MSNGTEADGVYKPGGIAEVVVNPLPRSRKRSDLHRLEGYYDFRNRIVDFLVSRASAH